MHSIKVISDDKFFRTKEYIDAMSDADFLLLMIECLISKTTVSVSMAHRFQVIMHRKRLKGKL